MRLFIAMELPQEVRQQFAGWQDALRELVRPKVSWTKPENLHLTLKFIGEANEEQTAAIRQALAKVAGQPLTLAIAGLMRLPPRGPTRVIGAKLTGEVAKLHARIETELEKCG